MKISKILFKTSLCSNALSRKDGTLWKNTRKIESGTKKLLKFSPQNGCFSAPSKEMYISFIFSFAKRTQRRFNVPEFEEHFIHKRVLCSILYWKTLNFVSTAATLGKRYADFQLKSKLLKYPSYYNCEYFLDICIWYNPLLPILFKQYKLCFLIRWWSKV